MCKDMREGSCSNGNTIIGEKYGSGGKSIGYGRSGNVQLTRKIILYSQRAECYAIKEHRHRPRETARSYWNGSTSSFRISWCLYHINFINILNLAQEPDGNFCDVMAFCDGKTLQCWYWGTKKWMRRKGIVSSSSSPVAWSICIPLGCSPRCQIKKSASNLHCYSDGDSPGELYLDAWDSKQGTLMFGAVSGAVLAVCPMLLRLQDGSYESYSRIRLWSLSIKAKEASWSHIPVRIKPPHCGLLHTTVPRSTSPFIPRPSVWTYSRVWRDNAEVLRKWINVRMSSVILDGTVSCQNPHMSS